VLIKVTTSSPVQPEAEDFAKQQAMNRQGRRDDASFFDALVVHVTEIEASQIVDSRQRNFFSASPTAEILMPGSRTAIFPAREPFSSAKPASSPRSGPGNSYTM